MREALHRYDVLRGHHQTICNHLPQAIHNSVACLLQFCAKIILFFRMALENYVVPSGRWHSQKIAIVGAAR